MRIIKLNAIQSTNDYLRALSTEHSCDDYTVVVTEDQTKGKGQRGNVWQSQPFKNLTFSVFKSNLNIDISSKFVLNAIASLAVYKLLDSLQFNHTAIKWPNDILTDNKKVCGILIENVIKGSKIDSGVIGIGLNVNQMSFFGLPKAISLKQITGINYNLDEVLEAFIKVLQDYFSLYENNGYSYILELYNKQLYRKEKPSTFMSVEGDYFMGFIQRVTPNGFLEVELEDRILKSFNLKELQLLY